MNRGNRAPICSLFMFIIIIRSRLGQGNAVRKNIREIPLRSS
jgi:hypothetical protein